MGLARNGLRRSLRSATGMKREAAVGRLTTVNLLDELDVADRRRDPVADEIVSDVEEPVDLGVSIFLLIEKGRTQGVSLSCSLAGALPAGAHAHRVRACQWADLADISH